jgi:adenosylcobinamide hydrolase
VTAGVDKNGGRAGDPASYYETDGKFESVGGTINILLIINASLPEYAMNRALITATEAKVVALQQLMAKSLYSSGIATGSGTDMMCIITNPHADLSLTDAGKHSKLGELIGKSVIQATTVALKLETGLSPESQQNVLVRLSRFGVTEDDIWEVASGLGSGLSREEYFNRLREKARDPELVALVSAVLHILDEAEWNLLPEVEVKTVACRLIREGLGLEKTICGEGESGPIQESILQCLNKAISEFIIREIHPDIPE